MQHVNMNLFNIYKLYFLYSELFFQMYFSVSLIPLLSCPRLKLNLLRDSRRHWNSISQGCVLTCVISYRSVPLRWNFVVARTCTTRVKFVGLLRRMTALMFRFFCILVLLDNCSPCAGTQQSFSSIHLEPGPSEKCLSGSYLWNCLRTGLRQQPSFLLVGFALRVWDQHVEYCMLLPLAVSISAHNFIPGRVFEFVPALRFLPIWNAAGKLFLFGARTLGVAVRACLDQNV